MYGHGRRVHRFEEGTSPATENYFQFGELGFSPPGAELLETGNVRRERPEVRPEAWGGEMLSETRPLSAPGSHMDGGPSRQPGRRATSHSAAGLRNEVELSRLKAQVAELQQKLGVAHLEVHQMRDRCDAADAEATLQRSIASTAKAQVAKLQQQLASRAELQVLEEKLRNTEECRASIESEREEERRQLQEKIQLAEVRATELEAELKRQRLSQDDTRALADHRCWETEERCKSMQTIMDDVTRSASAEMDAAAERVREFQTELESWQLWSEEEKERRKELETKLRSKDFEIQHLLQQLHVVNSQVENSQQAAADLRDELDFRGKEFERKMSQYKSRVETELQDASGRESEMKLELATKTQECDRLNRDISKTKELQEKIAGLQVRLDESERQRSAASVVRANLDVAEQRASELELQIATNQREHEHQLAQHRATRQRLDVAMAKAQDFEMQCKKLSFELEELQAKSSASDQEFARQLALHREEVCSAFSRAQEFERQLENRRLEEERLEEKVATKCREVQDLQAKLVKSQEQEEKHKEVATECTQLKADVQASKQELENEQSRSSEVSAKLEELEAQLQRSTEAFEEERKKSQNLEAQLKASKQELEKEHGKCSELDAQREQLEAQLQASKQVSEELELESTRFSELDTQREQLEAQLQASKQALKEMDSYKQRATESDALRQQLEEQLQESKQDLEAERARSSQLETQRQELEVIFGMVEAQLHASKQAVEEQTGALEEASAHVEGLGKSLKESEEKCQALWLRNEDLELKLNEVHNSAAEQITLFQEELKASKAAATLSEESFREKLADLSESKRQVAELQQMIKERDAEIENYEEILKGSMADQVVPVPVREECPVEEEQVRQKVVLHLEVAPTLSPTSSPGSPCAPGGLRTKGLHQGVSMQHICTSFLEEVEVGGCCTASSIFEVETEVVQKMTAGATCPVDGQLGAAYVHGLAGDQRSVATQLLSYSSATSLQDMVDSLKQHCHEVGIMDKAFIWLKALCWNLHRNDITDPMEIRAILDGRIRSIGHVLVLLSPWDEPQYFKRRWCLAEMEVALSLSQETPEVAITMLTPPHEVDRLGEAICSGGVAEMWQRMATLHLEDAVSKHVRVWIATLAEQWLRQRLAGRGAESQEASTACDTVGWLLREVSLHHRAAALLQDALQLALCGNENVDGLSSPVLCCLGTAMGSCCDQTEVLQSCDTAIQAHQQKGTLETMAGMELLSSFGAAMWMSGDPEGAARALQQAVFIRVANRTLENPYGAMLLRNFGVMKWAMGFHKESLELFEEAKRIRKCTGSFHGAPAAVLMMNMGYAKAELGDFQGSLEAFQDVLALLTVGSASSSMTFGNDGTFALPDPLDAMPCGATLLSSIAVARGNLGHYDDALRAYCRALLIRKSTRTMSSPAGAVLMRNKGMAHFGRKEYAEALSAYSAAKDIRKETGTLNTYSGANLLSNLASARVKTGDAHGAMEDCQAACDIHKYAGTLQTPGGQAALKQLKELGRCPVKAILDVPKKGPQPKEEETCCKKKVSKERTLKTPKNREKVQMR